MAAPRLVLLDTATLYFRAFHALPSSLAAPDGTPSGAVRGFVDMLAVLVERLRPAQLAACWDEDWRPAWRVARVPSYKAHRVATGSPDSLAEDVPPELGPQVDGVVDLLAALGVPRPGAPACEADDVIGVLATRASRAGTGVDVVSGDRDLLQLVDDGAGGAGRRVVWIGRGVKDADLVDDAALAARYDLPAGTTGRPAGPAGPARPARSAGDAYADLAVLRGDPSDGLPGVAGVGEKTAAALLRRHGDLLAVMAAAASGADGVTPAQRRHLAAAADYLDAAPRVVRVLRDGEVVEPWTRADDPDGEPAPGADAADVPALPAPPASLRAAVDDDALAAVAGRWGLRSGVDRLLDALSAASGGR